MWCKNLQCLSMRQIWTGHEFCSFPANDIELARKNLGQNHDRPLGDKQYLCKVRSYNVSSLKQDMDRSRFLNFSSQWPWTQKSRSCHTLKSLAILCEIKTSHFIQMNMKRDKIFFFKKGWLEPFYVSVFAFSYTYQFINSFFNWLKTQERRQCS